MSPSLRGRGLKLTIGMALIIIIPSPSLRGRGLKYVDTQNGLILFWSPSLRGRGLKWLPYALNVLDRVALFTRAWIEIVKPKAVCQALRSPSLRGRGLKFDYLIEIGVKRIVALFTRAWIEIIFPDKSINAGGSRPLYEGVD